MAKLEPLLYLMHLFIKLNLTQTFLDVRVFKMKLAIQDEQVKFMLAMAVESRALSECSDWHAVIDSIF